MNDVELAILIRKNNKMFKQVIDYGIELKAENKKLYEDYEKLDHKLEKLKAENKLLKRTNENNGRLFSGSIIVDTHKYINRMNNIKKLKECAEYYANPENWDIVCIKPDGSDNGAPIFCGDKGTASRILQEINNE